MNPLSSAFGLDIGDRTFKLVQVSKRRRDNPPYRIVSWGEVTVPEEAMVNGEILDMDKAVERVDALLRAAKGKLKGRAVVACLPEAKTFIKVIEVPEGATDEQKRQAVMTEVEQNIPLPLNDIYFDWQEIQEPTKTQSDPTESAAQPAEDAPAPPPGPKKIRVLLGAAPKDLVDKYNTLLERAGLAPIALEIEAMAIARASIPLAESGEDASGILDIGATRSSLVIFDRGALQMSISIPISGDEITDVIGRSLGVSLGDAELLKRECGLDASRCDDKIWNILLPLIDDMSEKIRNAFRFYKVGFPEGKRIEKLYLCGGGANIRDIDGVLSRKLTIKVRRSDPLVNLFGRFPKGFALDDTLKYSTAIGLAIRAADENEKYRTAFR